MITKEVIKVLYKQYPKRAKCVDCLDMAMLFDSAGQHHNLKVDMDDSYLIIGSLDPKSIFSRIKLQHIHAFVPFEDWVAIVLPASIIFLHKKSDKVSVHIKPSKPTLLQRVKSLFS